MTTDATKLPECAKGHSWDRFQNGLWQCSNCLAWSDTEDGCPSAAAPDLLPCPFCGGEASIRLNRWRTGQPASAWAGCDACRVYVQGVTVDWRNSDGSKERAHSIAAWNRRAPMDAQAGRTGAPIYTVHNGKTAAEWYHLYCQAALGTLVAGPDPEAQPTAPMVTEAEKILDHLIYEANGMADGADAKADADRWYRIANALHTVRATLTAALAKASSERGCHGR